MTDSVVRAYDPKTDAEALWELKRRFERELGAGGGPEKSATYDAKLDADYRERYLAWVARCVADEECLFVAEARGDGAGLDGYVFMLPERLAMVWDAAVVNEVYVCASRRGSGLADALFERGLAHARQQSLPLDRVVLDVDRENSRARAFYARHGFEHWGEMVARDL
ncbi:GNAT family N-acetyltransferase [Salinirubellus salinus]|uniref:GNAT family N-acetyltransferase n=1 Tax=Salinirubellus salinus TaxID=1364945 RepID=A0A9E7R4S0_9EURY|nr:GNAT family N-acetyltransferase [Salinirubellus salinus]UWM55602.1 GNAT family N-acetyltransferase [Salinirubellus salinus]